MYVALGWMAVVLGCLLFGPAIAPHPPGAVNLLSASKGPTPAFLFGTDELGRDIFSRVLVGARPPVIGALGIALGASTLSAVVGVTAGYMGGKVEAVVMRALDFFLALPALLVIIVVSGVVTGSYAVAIGLLAVLQVPWDARVLRAATLEQRHRPYVEAARLLGIGRHRIIGLHVLPNVLPLLAVNASLDFAYGLVALSGLTFVGLGVAPGTPDWGRMVYDNLSLITIHPLAVLAPAFAITLTAAAANVAGDWFYERLETAHGSRS